MRPAQKLDLWEPCLEPYQQEIFKAVATHLSETRSPTTIFYLQDIMRSAIKRFQTDFPGEVAYALKCMPEKSVVRQIVASGVNSFDVASTEEIRVVTEIASKAKKYFNNPVKSSLEIKNAYSQYGIRNFVVDSTAELNKFLALNIEDAKIAVRVAVPSGSNKYDFASKFGSSPAEAVDICRQLVSNYSGYSLCFHVGSQCVDEKAYNRSLEQCSIVAKAVGVEPDFINIGGGFPVFSSERVDETIARYISRIRAAAELYNFRNLMCEPGRAIVAQSGVAALKVRLRSHNRIFLSDGVYGLLGELNHLDCDFPVAAIVKNPSGRHANFRLFGPTCDSFDQIDRSITLDDAICEDDWILIGNMGAYSWSLANSFNGFQNREIVLI